MAQEVLNLQKQLRKEKYNPFTSTKMFINILERYKDKQNIHYFVDYNESIPS